MAKIDDCISKLNLDAGDATEVRRYVRDADGNAVAGVTAWLRSLRNDADEIRQSLSGQGFDLSVRYLPESAITEPTEEPDLGSNTGDNGVQGADQAGDAGSGAQTAPAARPGRASGSGRGRARGTGAGGPRTDNGREPVSDTQDTGGRPDGTGVEDQPGDDGVVGVSPGTGVRLPLGAKSRGRDGSKNFVAAVGSLARSGSWKATAARNLDIIELVKKLEAEGRQATPEEQSLIAKFTGWGASEIANGLFGQNVKKTAAGRELQSGYWTKPEWKDLVDRAAEILKGDDLETALQSTQYAHYTSEAVIRSIWKAVERIGFKGGPILEPGMGTGLFAIAAPSKLMTASSYTGIEMDKMTAAIAKQLLPQETVLNVDFVKQKMPDGYFAMAIGNPPFWNNVITDDPAYRKQRFLLHDYFFAKSIDKVQPGGALVFVTSKGTMDKLDDKARQYLADRADLLGAIRLPQTAFKDNAGTAVVTDVIFLRKRLPGEKPAGEPWRGNEKIKTPEGIEFLINEYFVKHPEMVLGSHSSTGSMYRQNEYTVLPPEGDIEEHFAAAVEKLPKGVIAPYLKDRTQDKQAAAVARDFNPKATKEGMVYVSDAGDLMVLESGAGISLAQKENLSQKEVAWLKDYVAVRDAIKQAQSDQLKDGDWEASLKKLNQVYDKFVKVHGRVSAFTTFERKSEDEDGNVTVNEYRRFKNAKLLELDVEGELVPSLERITEDGRILKGPFFEGRTLKTPVAPEIKTIQDAFNVSLDLKGTLDLAHIAELFGITRDKAIEQLGDLVYQTPGGEWQTADEYLSGDVVGKLEEARSIADRDPRFERNVEALIKVQPKPLTPTDITVKLGAGWVPTDVVEQFAEEVLGEPTSVSYEPTTGLWRLSESRTRSRRSTTKQWGTQARSPLELLAAVLSNSSIKITRTIDKKTVTDDAATALANQRAGEMAERFKTWVWEDGKRSSRLLEIYNRSFNNLARRRFDGSHLSLPGLSLKYKLHPHQKRAIWRIIQTGNTYLGHAVGAGKTLEMIVAAMEQRRLGLINRPMFVVPNHMLNQFAREFLDAYPTANIMVASEKNFHTGNRRRFIAQASLNNPDAIILTHSSFSLLPTKDETRRDIVDRMVADLEAVLDELKGGDDRVPRKKIEQQIEAIKRRFEAKAGNENKDAVVTFEDMGVDFLNIDEAHEFRKLDFATNRSGLKGIDPNGSAKALDLYIKTRHLDKLKPGRSLVMASGTPVTNTMAELFTVMRYMDEPALERDGLRQFDAWASQFGEAKSGLEQNAAGRYEMVTRFAKFVNVPELMKRVSGFMDILTSSQLGALVPRPALKTGLPINVVAQAQPALKAYMDNVLNPRIEESRKWKPSPDQPGNPDPIINIITDGRLSAIDLRFVTSAKNDPTSKLNMMIDKIIEKHKENKQQALTDPKTEEESKGATQIVFSAVGFGEQVAASRGFDVRGWMMQRFREAGIPASEVAWMSDYDTNAKKEAMFKEMRQGKKTILIGSPKNMGTGLNVQNRLRVLHYLSPPWYPADVEQPHGRIIRQGNWNKEVEIYWYATKGTYDSTGWSMVARKARFIEQAYSGDDSVRVLEDVSDANQYEMASALAAGDERAIQLAGLRGDLTRLENLREAHFREQSSLNWEQSALKSRIKSTKGWITKLKEAIAAAGEYEPFRLTVGGKSYEKHKEAGEALIENIRSRLNKWTPVSLESTDYGEIGKYGKVHRLFLHLSNTGTKESPKLAKLTVVTTDAVYSDAVDRRSAEEWLASDPVAVARAVQRRVDDLPGDLRSSERELGDAETRLREVEAKIGAPFPYGQEYAEKIAEYARLEAELTGSGLAGAGDMSDALALETWDGEGGAPAFDPFGDVEEIDYLDGPLSQYDMFGGDPVPEAELVIRDKVDNLIADMRAEGMDTEDMINEAYDRGNAYADTKPDLAELWLRVEKKLNAEVDAPGPMGLSPAFMAKGGTKEANNLDVTISYGDPDQAAAAKVQAAVEGKTAQEVADYIAANGPADFRVIAERVRSTIETLQQAGMTIDFKVAHVGDSVPRGLTVARGAAVHTLNKTTNHMTVWVNGADVTGKVGMRHETLLHELVHGATMLQTRLGNLKSASGSRVYQATQDLYAVANRVLDHYNARAKAGKQNLTPFELAAYEGRTNPFRSVDEVIAWGLTNRGMQDYLEAIPYKKDQSLFSRFVEAIRRLLGLPVEADTALSEVLRISDQILGADPAELRSLVRTVQAPVGPNTALSVNKRPYEAVPDSLMGFRRFGQNKTFQESKYKHVQWVEIKWQSGEPYVDAIKGLNKAHALERARRNWPDAVSIEPIESPDESIALSVDRAQSDGSGPANVDNWRARESTRARLMTFAVVQKELRRQLDAMGLTDVRDIVVDTLPKLADGKQPSGWYDAETTSIAVAYKAATDRSRRRVLHHEAFHAFRNLNLLTKEEWAIIRGSGLAADWMTAYDVKARWEGYTPEQQLEEAAAEAFGDYAVGMGTWDNVEYTSPEFEKKYPKAARIFKALAMRLGKFIEAVGNWVKRLGYRTVDDVFADLLSGKIGARVRPAERLDYGAAMAPSLPPADPVRFEKEETERRWQDARQGVASTDSFIHRITDGLEHWWNAATRHYIALPNEARFANVREQLRKLEAAPTAAKERIVRILRSITDGMTAADLDLFTRKVVLDDLAWEVTQEHEIAFGLSEDDVAVELRKVDQALATRPDLREKVRKRKLIVRRISQDMVAAGVLRADQVRNPSYYRHQVVDFARAQQKAYAEGGGDKLRTPRWAKRMGSKLDINANLLEAEFDWLHKALVNIAEAKTIKWIKDSNLNIRRDLSRQAKESNKDRLEMILDRDMQDNGYVTSTGRETSPLNEINMEFRRSIAMGLQQVRGALDNGNIDVPEEFREVADSLQAEDTAAGDPEIFRFLTWLMDSNSDGAMGAALVFKGVTGRKQWMKALLGKNYADPLDVAGLVKRFAPEGYVVWSPDEAKMMFLANTLPEHVIEHMRSSAIQAMQQNTGLNAKELLAGLEQVDQVLVVGGRKHQLVLPEELAKTLNQLTPPASETLVRVLVEKPNRMWKSWILFNPRRVAKYFINNLSGDLDAVIAGSPRILKRLPEAMSELYRVIYKGAPPSARYREAVERGVFDSGLTIQEIPDINELAEFEHLLDRKLTVGKAITAPMMAYWNRIRQFNQFRENWLRYAAYLDYADRLERGDTMKQIGYGAAVREMVDAVTDKKDKAALLARELMGDYGAVSHMGQLLRRRAVPFWSWLEINTKRYWRLTGNAYQQGLGEGLRVTGTKAVTLGAAVTVGLGLRAATLWAIVWMWNNWGPYADDEDELDPLTQSRLHINLGRDADGKVRVLRFQGALSDAISWFGFSDAAFMLDEVEKGRASWGDVLTAIAKAPVNKIAGGISPFIKMPFELATGQELWPDFFNPRPIRDKWRHVVETFSAENEYDLVLGKPSRGYAKSITESIVEKKDVGEVAYNQSRAIAYDWLERVKGREGISTLTTPRSIAVHDWRRALRYGDKEAAAEAMRDMRALGMTKDDIREALRRGDPLAPIALKDRPAFFKTLDAKERLLFQEARKWYQETYIENARQ